jgi:hypothetical protein
MLLEILIATSRKSYHKHIKNKKGKLVFNDADGSKVYLSKSRLVF